MVTFLEAVLIVLISSSIAFYLACAVFTYRFFASAPFAEETSTPASGVSILVPVCGVDATAWENWSSLCQQDYPTYEVLFGVMNPNDPAVPVLEKLVAQFPDRTSLLTELKPRGINHKDSNLSYLLEKSQYEVIIFADSDIQVGKNYIHTVTSPLINPKVGLVTCAFIGYTPRFLGAALASIGRCFDFIPSLLLAQVVDGGLRCAVGVTMATRKSALANFGGLHFNRIGSDYNLGKRAAEAGYIVELSRYVLESDTGNEQVGQVFQRELRWARTIRYNRGPQYYTMMFCFGTVYCLPLLLLAKFSAWAIGLSIATFAIRLLQVLVAVFSIQAPALLRWLWLLPLRDALSFVVWVMGAFGQRVYWRGRELRVIGDGLITQWE